MLYDLQDCNQKAKNYELELQSAIFAKKKHEEVIAVREYIYLYFFIAHWVIYLYNDNYSNISLCSAGRSREVQAT